MATFTADSTGRMIATAGPALHIPPPQTITGSLIDAASAKTLAAQQTQASAARALGVGQRAGSRRKMRKMRKMRGGAVNLNAQVPYIPEAGSIRGVSHETNHLTAVNNLNQIRADAVYDTQINASPLQVAGRARKTRRKANGRRDNRTHRRKRGKSAGSRRRGSRSRK